MVGFSLFVTDIPNTARTFCYRCLKQLSDKNKNPYPTRYLRVLQSYLVTRLLRHDQLNNLNRIRNGLTFSLMMLELSKNMNKQNDNSSKEEMKSVLILLSLYKDLFSEMKTSAFKFYLCQLIALLITATPSESLCNAPSKLELKPKFDLVFALKCWNCNSLTDFCGDSFTGNASNEQHSWALQECRKSPASSFRESNRPVCLRLKMFYSESNETVIHRACHWQSENTSKDSCHYTATPVDERIESCETCATDECNAGLRFKVWTLLISLSVFMNVKFLLL